MTISHLGACSSLWSSYKTDADPAARVALIEQYLHLVRITVSRVCSSVPRSVDREDLIAAGSVGLIHAVDRFDPARGLRFETYAIILIKGAIKQYLRDQDPLSRTQRDRVRAVEAAVLYLTERNDRPPTQAEVAAFLGIDSDVIAAALADYHRVMTTSIDSAEQYADDFASEDSEEAERDREGLTSKEPSPFDALVGTMRREALIGALDRLPERERRALALYHSEGLTCREVGTALGVCESRAYQILQQALGRLRKYLAADVSLFDVE